MTNTNTTLVEELPQSADETPSVDETYEAIPEPTPGLSLTIRMSTIVWSAATVVLLILVCVLGGFLWHAESTLSDRDSAAADTQHAEQVATDYAVGASTLNSTDFNAWIAKLKANTAPKLSQQYDATAPKLEQLMVPLKWTSSATPIAAKVKSVDNGIYQVAAFVNLTTSNVQNPDGITYTATFDVTIDKSSGWKITDVGGVAGALGMK